MALGLGLVIFVAAAALGQQTVEHWQRTLEVARAGDDPVMELDVLNRLGLALEGEGRYSEALASYREASELVVRLDDPVKEAWTRLHLGRALVNLGTLDEALGHLERFLELARGRPELRAAELQARGWLGSAYLARASFNEARRHQQRALALARGVGDRIQEVWLLVLQSDIALGEQRPDEALAILEPALALARLHQERTIEAQVLTRMALLEDALGDYESASAHLEQNLVIARETGNKQAEAYARLHLGRVSFSKFRFEPARESSTDALAMFRRSSDSRGEVLALGSLAMSELWLGNFDRAESLLKESWQRADDGGEAGALLSVLDGLAVLYLASDRRAEALEAQERSLEVVRGLGNRSREVTALLSVADSRFRLGRFGTAREAAEEALAIARKTGDTVQQCFALNGLAHVRQLDGELEEALRLYQASASLARASDHPVLEQTALLGAGIVFSLLDRDADAFGRLESALRLVEAEGCSADQGAIRLALGAIHGKLGSFDEAEAELERARALLLAAGSPQQEIIVLGVLGRVQAAGRNPAAVDSLRRAVAEVERIGPGLDERALSSDFTGLTPAGLFEALIGLLTDLGHAAEAIEVERRKTAYLARRQPSDEPAIAGRDGDPVRDPEARLRRWRSLLLTQLGIERAKPPALRSTVKIAGLEERLAEAKREIEKGVHHPPP